MSVEFSGKLLEKQQGFGFHIQGCRAAFPCIFSLQILVLTSMCSIFPYAQKLIVVEMCFEVFEMLVCNLLFSCGLISKISV